MDKNKEEKVVDLNMKEFTDWLDERIYPIVFMGRISVLILLGLAIFLILR